MLLQCVRYVVQNNFFGLEGTLQNPMVKRDAIPPNVLPREHDRQQQQVLLEEDVLKSQSGCLGGGKRRSAESKEEGFKTTGAVGCEHWDRVLQSDQEYSEQSKVDSPAIVEEVAEDHLQYAEETKDCHSLHLASTENITSTSNIYDDEIWESPGAVV